MTWFFIAISGYFLYAFSSVLDKFLLRQRATTKPLVYAFYVALFSIFSFILAPWGLTWPGYGQFFLSLLVGVIFFCWLLFLYRSLDRNEASQALPIIGALTPIFVLLLAYIFLGDALEWQQLAAFILLVIGGFFVSFKFSQAGPRFIKDFWSLGAAIIFSAVYLVLAKYIFSQQGFISGFIWSRLGLVLAAVLVLVNPVWRRTIFSASRQATSGVGFILVANKFMSGLGSLFVNWAVSLGSVALVNAMQGIEYAFLLALVILFSKKFPKIIKEKMTAPIIWQKTLAIILIGIGLALLVL